MYLVNTCMTLTLDSDLDVLKVYLSTNKLSYRDVANVAIQGHSRLSIAVTIDVAYMTSYY